MTTAKVMKGRPSFYHGGASGLDAIADTQLEPNQASAFMGLAVSGAGDVNGDGYDDVIVTSGSKPFLYFGGSGGVDGIADVKLEIPISCSADSVSGAGDVNGDGYDDVIVGSHFYDSAQPGEGVAFLYYGSASGMDPIADGQFESNQNGAEMGWSASTAGDVDRDGYDDVIVGAHHYDNGQTDEGAAFIYHGSSIATITTADLSITKVANATTPPVGQTLTYLITVSNAGPASATSVVVTDVLPAGLTFQSATPAQGECAGTTTVTCSLGTIISAASASITLEVTRVSDGALSNTASVVSAQTDTNPLNNAATATIGKNPRRRSVRK
jgi:uncharacterized repeat protein (TIGR01451 family)